MPGESLSLIIPVRNQAAAIGPLLRGWHEALARDRIEHQLIVVDDASTDDTAATAERCGRQLPGGPMILLQHAQPLGVGACWRTGLEHARGSIVGLVRPDYPYAPADARRMLARFDDEVDLYGVRHAVDAVNGCRTGRPVPAGWRWLGRCYRTFMRVALGIRPEPLPGWLGLHNHLRSWWLWLVFASPLVDPGSGLKFVRRHLLERCPVQTDGEFALVELFAKLTFLGAILAEEPLTPRAAPVPSIDLTGWWTLLRDARFNPPKPRMQEIPTAASVPPG